MFSPKCVILALTLALAGCSRHEATPDNFAARESPSPSPASHLSAFSAAADRIRPAVVVLVSFDEGGRLAAKQHALFTSAGGDLLADSTAMKNAASAMVKGADGSAYDILGSFLPSSQPNFVLLRVQARDRPHVNPLPPTKAPDGTFAAVVLSSGGNTGLIMGKVNAHKSVENGTWLTFDPAPPQTSIGAPVIDEKGALIGIVSQRDNASAPAVFSWSPEKNPAVAKKGASPTPPDRTSPWETLAAVPAPAEGPAEKKATVAPARQNPPRLIARRGKLVYTPAPAYPRTLQWTRWSVRSSGRYRLSFSANGEATGVEVVQSAGHPALDKAAEETLRTWRCEAGAPSTMVVPVAFNQ